MSDWADEILEQLDEAAEQFSLPGIPNEYYVSAAMRMTAFRSDEEWLLVFEVVGWAIRELEFQNTVSAFGNKLETVGHQADPAVVTGPGGAPLFDDDGEFLLDPSDFEVEINGKKHHLKPSDEDYEQAGIELDDPEMEPPARVIRLLAHKFREELFFPDERLLEICGRKDAGLERFLQVDDWQLPDLVEDEKPSELECNKSLARALAEGDKSLYACPEADFNTHWSNWVE